MSVYINFLFVFLLLEFVGESELAYNMKRKLDLQTAVTLCKFFNQYTGTDNEQLSPHGLTLNDDQSNPGPSRRAVPLHSGHGEYYIFVVLCDFICVCVPEHNITLLWTTSSYDG